MDDTRESISSLFPIVHRSVENLTVKFFEDKKRHVYVTPKSYLDALYNFEF